MSQEIKTKTLYITGMTCVNCENVIERKVKKTKGMIDIQVSYSSGKAVITYDSKILLYQEIEDIIESLNYKIIKNNRIVKQKMRVSNIIASTVCAISLYMLLRNFGILTMFNIVPQVNNSMEYGMLFIVGFLTSFHCVAMCGGINLSQSLHRKETKNTAYDSLKPTLLYNIGRVLSYTIVGAVVGALGNVVSFSGTWQGIIQLLVGVCMVLMGLRVLPIFPSLRKINIRMPKSITKRIYKEKTKNNHSLYIGMLNGLMPCGPLQTMQLYALSTGSPIQGALSMLLFSLGTVPLMFIMGSISSLLNKRFTSKATYVSAVLVVIMGMSMFHNGISLSGVYTPFAASQNEEAVVAKKEDEKQNVTTKLSSGGYEPIIVSVDIPVNWVLEVEEGSINGCNNEVIVREYNIRKTLHVGKNSIEFLPTKTGTYVYSCWMGMIQSTITVVE